MRLHSARRRPISMTFSTVCLPSLRISAACSARVGLAPLPLNPDFTISSMSKTLLGVFSDRVVVASNTRYSDNPVAPSQQCIPHNGRHQDHGHAAVLQFACS